MSPTRCTSLGPTAARPSSRKRLAVRLAALTWGLVHALAAGPGAADLVMETSTRFGDGSAGSLRHGRIWLDASRIRIELTEPARPDRVTTLIFLSDRELYWALDPEARQYVEIDRESLDAAARRTALAREDMRTRLAALPPDERSEVEAMLGDLPDHERPPGVEEVMATQVLGQRHGLPTRLHRMLQGGELVGEIWTVEWKHVGARRLDFRVFRKLAEFQRALLASLGPGSDTAFGGEPFEVFDRLDGYPIQVRRLRDGVLQAETRFELPRKVPSQPGRFELPEGYERRPESAVSE